MGDEHLRYARQTCRWCDIFFFFLSFTFLHYAARDDLHAFVCVEILGAAAKRLFNCRLILSGRCAQLKKTFFMSACNTISS